MSFPWLPGRTYTSCGSLDTPKTTSVTQGPKEPGSSSEQWKGTRDRARAVGGSNAGCTSELEARLRRPCRRSTEASGPGQQRKDSAVPARKLFSCYKGSPTQAPPLMLGSNS